MFADQCSGLIDNARLPLCAFALHAQLAHVLLNQNDFVVRADSATSSPCPAAACAFDQHIFLWFCRQRYITTSREIKRWDATSRSPVYASFSATLKVCYIVIVIVTVIVGWPHTLSRLAWG
jgi:hypothetical protein